MNDTAQGALAVGAGILIGKLGGNIAWWALGGVAVVFVLNSPATKTTIGSVGKTAYSAISKRI